MLSHTIAVIPQEVNGQAISTINLRDIHVLLDVKKKFPDWIKTQIDRGRFLEGKDYVTQALSPSGEICASKTYPAMRVEYFGTTQMAEHIGMLSGTEKGFEVREYFRDMRDKAKGFSLPVGIDGNLLIQAGQQMIQLQLDNSRLLQEVRVWQEYGFRLERELQVLEKSETTFSLTATAKLFTMNPGMLTQVLLEKKMLRLTDHLPMQRHMDKGRLVAVEISIENLDSSVLTKFQTRVTGKGIRYLIRKLKEWGYIEKSHQPHFKEIFEPLP